MALKSLCVKKLGDKKQRVFKKMLKSWGLKSFKKFGC